MIEFLVQPQNIAFIVVLIGVLIVAATVIIPMFEKDKMKDRMKSVALEREQIRARERARMMADKNGTRERAKKKEPDKLIKQIVDKFNLRNALADEATTASLMQAGLRGQSPLFTFLAARFILPFIAFGIAALYLFAIWPNEYTTMQRILGSFLAAGLGFYLPVLYVNNLKDKRQQEMTLAIPDALDLCLICVESGMPIENAFRRVSEEIGAQSMSLAEELSITVAELSYLQERRQAYDNLAKRTGLESIKDIVVALVQAEKYGTPLSQVLRVLSRENRDQRMNKAEKKAAALPPKMTVPMMIFFLPILFILILGPAIISSVAQFNN